MTKVTGSIYGNDEVFPYLEASMIGEGQSVIRVISGVSQNPITTEGGTEEKYLLSFFGSNKKLILTKTNIRRLIALFGSTVESWTKRPIELHTEMVSAFGKTHRVLRIKEEIPTIIPKEQRNYLAAGSLSKPDDPVSDNEARRLLAQRGQRRG